MSYIDDAIAAVDAALEQHRVGEKAAPFSSQLLASVRSELQRMIAVPDYRPGYGRFVLDWPESSGPLGKQLLETAYLRDQSLKRR